MQMPAPGEIFQGKYKIIDVLGKGGFAHVFRAEDVEVGREVAIKVLMPQGAGYDEKIESRFMREARVIARLQDPHTITMFEFGRTDDGLLFMVFEFVQGQDLSEVLKAGAIPPPIVERVLRQMLSALNEAHTNGVLHRDLKPANVIVFPYMDDPWRVKLIDFGIAKPTAREQELTKLTQDGTVVGTPRYMAPEQFYGDDLTASADIYSLGLVAHEMLTGRPAIGGTTSQELIRSALSLDAVRLPPIPGAEGLSAVIDRMTEHEPSARFQTAMSVVTALEIASRPQPPPSAPRVDSGRFSSESRRALVVAAEPPPHRGNYATAVLGAGALALIVVVAIGITLAGQADEESAPIPTRTKVNTLLRPADPPPREMVVEPFDTGVSTGQATGCGEDPGFRGSRTLRLQLGFEKRQYEIYIPRNYDPNVKHAVSFVFHNALKDGRSVISETTFDQIADRENVILIGPNSLGGARPWFSADDVELTQESLRAVSEIACIDPTRLYALGHGGGGNFALRLRCQLPLSAIAISASGEHEGDVMCESEPTPFLRLYGTKDKHVPAEGGNGCFDTNPFVPATLLDKQWSARNGATGKGRTWIEEKNGKCTLWAGDAAYASCAMDGGHDWPGAEAKFEIPGCASPPPDFPMAETVWRFFAEHARTLSSDASPATTQDQ